MGCQFELGLMASDHNFAEQMLDVAYAELSRIESVFTEFDPASETSKVNRYAGGSSVVVSDEFFQLTQRALAIAKLTQGHFDLTTAALKKLYSFKKEGNHFPNFHTLQTALKSCGMDQLILDAANNTIRYKHNKTRINFAAIGKGYAADVVRRLWKHHGVLSGYINASGDLCAWGLNDIGKPWQVGIKNPLANKGSLFYLPIEDGAIATSGNYEQYFDYKGTRFSHTIHPKTGIPVTEMMSVSVISPSAELSDALATAVTVMGTENGLALIDALPKTFAIAVTADAQVQFSKAIQYVSA